MEEPQIILKSRDTLLQSAVAQINEQEQKKKKKAKRRKRHEDINPYASFDIPGVTKIVISQTAQKAIECSVGEDVTVENPWKYVSKEAFEDNLKHEKESELVKIKDELLNNPRPELLLGYIPGDNRDYDEFYICLTEPAEEAVSEIIGEARKQQEEKLNSMIFKKAHPWKTQGSEPDVELLIVKNNRALLEIELETQYPVISSKSEFRLRMVEDARDGYVELLPGRIVYDNIPKQRIDSCLQITPPTNSNEAQTVYTYPKSAWTQYEYEYEPIVELSPDLEKSLQTFMAQNTSILDDMIYVNSDINFYKNDYANLVKNKKYTQIVQVSKTKEFMSFVNNEITKGKPISLVAWHPMWTGTLAIAYSNEAANIWKTHKVTEDEVTKALYDLTPILLWSFTDSLHPKLFLETRREVTAISFCPFYADLLVGGCTNGQVIMWDLKGQLHSTEMDDTLTLNQQMYRNLMYSMLKWMKHKDLKMVRVTATSDLENSHKSAITEIQWFSPFREISKLGTIGDIPENENRTSLQFMTASKDGTVLFWDLQARPVIQVEINKRSKRQRRIRQLPSALNVDESPLRALNRILKPMFKVDVLSAKRNLPLSALSFDPTPFKYKQQQRAHYKPILTKPTDPLLHQFVAGTVEGDFLTASWEGLEFDMEEPICKQTCKLENFSKFHDGPIISLSRSELLPDLILTVGGKIFALWNINFKAQPILWRRSKHRYTHGVWNTHRPSIFRLTRDDGHIEIWNFRTRSDRYEEKQQVSSSALTGTHTSPINLKLMGVADSNGSFRIFNLAEHLSQTQEDDAEIFRKLCEREVERKLGFIKWQEHWKQRNAEWLKAKKDQERKLQLEQEAQFKRKKREMEELKKQQEKEEAARLAFLAKPEPGKLAEWADRRWKEKEQKRLGKVLLNKKGLDREFLEKQQLPLTKITEEKDNKKKKQDLRLKETDKLFNSAVARLFPEAVEKKVAPTPDPYARADPPSVKAAYYNDYLETVKQCEEFMIQNGYEPEFKWQKILKQGKERRKFLDPIYGKRNHRNRLLDEKNKSGI